LWLGRCTPYRQDRHPYAKGNHFENVLAFHGLASGVSRPNMKKSQSVGS
jgi:hypothetical protein